jgi:hypothetical protein
VRDFLVLRYMYVFVMYLSVDRVLTFLLRCCVYSVPVVCVWFCFAVLCCAVLCCAILCCVVSQYTGGVVRSCVFVSHTCMNARGCMNGLVYVPSRLVCLLLRFLITSEMNGMPRSLN